MAYIVQSVYKLYRDEERSEEDEIGEFLSTAEAQGFTLVGIIPDHRVWDENMEPDGKGPSMLVLHKPDETPDALSIFE